MKAKAKFKKTITKKKADSTGESIQKMKDKIQLMAQQIRNMEEENLNTKYLVASVPGMQKDIASFKSDLEEIMRCLLGDIAPKVSNIQKKFGELPAKFQKPSENTPRFAGDSPF